MDHPGASETEAGNAAADDAETAGLLIQRYHALRARLVALQSAALLDMAAVDGVMHEIDETHAAFKAQESSGIDHQRY